eukprot:TRINITY_DN32671_c0_g1_i1.p1 TRINITY_DN32671_c0_g1~~TRINITY_DN32671_c0_g1_i1.p1  ORF type:complete len:388 (-),score=88.46 TRINITY_DN32671_c0_g1_i1:102-1265(-)
MSLFAVAVATALSVARAELTWRAFGHGRFANVHRGHGLHSVSRHHGDPEEDLVKPGDQLIVDDASDGAAAHVDVATAPLHFVSVNTQGEIALKSEGHFPEDVINAGKGKQWKGYGTKLVEILSVVSKLQADDMLVYVDGNDVTWGGCSKAQFLQSYQEIRDASGAPVVFGAEMVCGEQECGGASSAIPPWALTRAKPPFLRMLAEGELNECTEQVKSECRCDRPSSPPCRAFFSNYSFADIPDFELDNTGGNYEVTFKYLNSGFFIGPVRSIRKMLEWSVFHYIGVKNKKYWMHDQGVLAEYRRLNPTLVTLDYFGELALSLPRVSKIVLQTEVSEGGRRIARSKLLGNKAQCFIHNNIDDFNGGQRLQYWWNFMRTIDADSRDWFA